MKIKDVIEKLCNHDMNKHEAETLILGMIDSVRNGSGLEFKVEEVFETTPNEHAILKVKMPYQFSKIRNKIKVGDLIEVNILHR